MVLRFETQSNNVLPREAVPPGLWVPATKRLREVAVAFAKEATLVETLEGTVQADAGDAVLTGIQGERWPVERERFFARYQPAPGTVQGMDGTYLTRCQTVRAARLSESFEVKLDGGRGTLSGKAGDWLLDYGDGSLGAVDAEIFEATYVVD